MEKYIRTSTESMKFNSNSEEFKEAFDKLFHLKIADLCPKGRFRIDAGFSENKNLQKIRYVNKVRTKDLHKLHQHACEGS